MKPPYLITLQGGFCSFSLVTASNTFTCVLVPLILFLRSFRTKMCEWTSSNAGQMGRAFLRCGTLMSRESISSKFSQQLFSSVHNLWTEWFFKSFVMKWLRNIPTMKWLVLKHFHVKYFSDVHVWMGYQCSRVDGPAKFSWYTLISESSSREVFPNLFSNISRFIPKWSSTREDLHSKISSNIFIIVQRWSFPEWLVTTNTQ